MKRTIFVFSIVFFGPMIMGCAETQWYKPGVTKQMYEFDKDDCERKILDSPGTGYQGSLYSFESCMEGKGYMPLDHKAM